MSIKNAITLAPGTSNNVKYEVSTALGLPKPHGKCMDRDGEFIEKYNKSIYNNPTGCVSLCLTKEVIAKCGCIYAKYSIVWFNPNRSLPYCGDLKQPIEKVFEYIMCAKNVRLLSRYQCLQSCPLPCELVRYSTTVSHGSWPAERHHESFYDEMIRNRSFQEAFDNYVSSNDTTLSKAIYKNFLHISCYLGSYRQTVIEDKVKMNITDLLSQIGSILNMWCGITVVFLVEIIELFSTIMSNWIRT